MVEPNIFSIITALFPPCIQKTGHGPHSSTYVVICVVRLLFVLFYVLFVCKCLLLPCDNPIADNKYIVPYKNCISSHAPRKKKAIPQNKVHKWHQNFVSSVWNLFYDRLLATRIWRWILHFFFKFVCEWRNTNLANYGFINPLNPELNPICYLLALLGAHHFFYVSRIRVKLLTFRRLMSYIYIWSTHSWCF